MPCGGRFIIFLQNFKLVAVAYIIKSEPEPEPITLLIAKSNECIGKTQGVLHTGDTCVDILLIHVQDGLYIHVHNCIHACTGLFHMTDLTHGLSLIHI